MQRGRVEPTAKHRIDRSRWVGRAVLAVPMWLVVGACGPGPAGHPAGGSPPGAGVHVRQAFSRELPAMDGARLRVTVLEVTYGPGDSSAPHRHPCPVVGYVTRGAVRMRVAGGAEAVFHAGESFYEAPNGDHVVSANASREHPATFLAFFTCDRETRLSVPIADSSPPGDDRQ
jgi:quercetin dioxygenase-like cupin family protein